MSGSKKGLLNRYMFIMLMIFIFASLIVGKLFKTTVIDAPHWNDKADSIRLVTNEIKPERGNILASDGSMLAVNVRFFDVRVDFKSAAFDEKLFLKNINALCDSLAAFGGKRNASEWKKLFDKELAKPKEKRSTRVTLFRGCSHDEYMRLRSFPFFKERKGRRVIYKEDRNVRIRPFGTMASRSIGGVKTIEGEAHGASGLEKALDSLLFGKPGRGRKIQLAGGMTNWEDIAPTKGYDIKTTIDIRMQDILETELQNICTETDAQWGTAVLMEVATGEIKAISNLERDSTTRLYSERVNHAVLGYEPGSVVKPIAMMIALDENLVRLDERIATGKRFAYASGPPISDTHPYTSLTPAEIIEVSSNIGMSKIIIRGFEKNPGRFYSRMKEIGMLDPLNLGIAGETIPKIDSLGNKNWHLIDLTRTSYGYRSRIPPIYTLAMYNAMANGGKFVRPRLVKELWKNGVCDSVFPVSYVREQVCSPETAAAMCDMLKQVVWGKKGTAKALQNNFVSISGKTGTAYDIINGKYDFRKKRLAFCGFFPSENPKYSCIVLMSHANRGAARSSGMVLMNTALKMYARGMLGNVSDYRKEPDNRQTPPTLHNMSAETANAVKTVLHTEKARRLRNRPAKDGIPSVTGMGLREAVRTLESAGLNVTAFEGSGYVYAQYPAAGTKYANGDKIKLKLKN